MPGKSVTCSRCASAMELHSEDSLTVVCRNCGLAHHLTGDGPKAVGAATPYGPKPALRTGMQGRFREHDVAIIGMTRYRVESWFWDNYQLLDETGVVSWISHDSFRFKLSETPQLPSDDWKAQLNNVFADESVGTIVINGVPASIEERGQAELMFLEGELPWPAEPGELLRYVVTDMYVFEAAGPDADIIVPIRVSHAEIRSAFALPWWWRRLDWFSSKAMPLSGDPRKKNIVVGTAVTAGVGLGVLMCAGVFSDDDPPGLDGAKVVWLHKADNDSTGGSGWNAYANSPELLNKAWVPPAASPWLPYAKLPLINSVDMFGGRVYPVRPIEKLDPIADAIKAVLAGPAEGGWGASGAGGVGSGTESSSAGGDKGDGTAAPAPGAPAAPTGAVSPDAAAAKLRKSAVILDLPGPQSVAWATTLARDYGHQPVITVNNVPHQSGVIAHHQTLGALLYYSAEMSKMRTEKKIADNAPPAFILERGRLRPDAKIGSDVYDNRYYHVEGDFPKADVLKSKGIEAVWYVYPAYAASPNWDSDDMNNWLVALDAAGITVIPVAAEVPQPEGAGAATPARTATARRTSGSTYRPYHRPVFFTSYILYHGGGFGGYAGSRIPSSYGSRSYGSGGYGGSSTSSSGSGGTRTFSSSGGSS